MNTPIYYYSLPIHSPKGEMYLGKKGGGAVVTKTKKKEMYEA